MNIFLQRHLPWELLRSLWLIVAVAVAFGVHSPRTLELTHSHSHSIATSHTHGSYSEFVKAEKNKQSAPDQHTHKHTHRIPHLVDAPAMFASMHSLEIIHPSPASLIPTAGNADGPQRAGDRLIRPPQAA